MKTNEFRSIRRAAGILGLAALVCAAWLLVPRLRADDGPAETHHASRAVRLSSVDGEVRLSQGNQGVVDQAVPNTPLFEGTRIDTGSDGRAEIQFEDGSVARVSPQSSLTLATLRGAFTGADRDAELLLNSGLAYFEIQGDTNSNHIRVRFGDAVITTTGFTVLRVNLDKAPGEVAVFSGNAHLEGSASPTLDLRAGESVALNANDPNTYYLADTIEPDSWDAWNADRDQELNGQAADRTEATGSLPDSKNPAWNDLDANGDWYNVPDQGYVWSPNDASSPDWDPYGNGYWMDSPGYGYMWVSGYSWGYLPYQCGAWNYYSSFGWGWAPGHCTPWWGGYGGWGFNIGHAPLRYRFPVRPRHPGSPRPATPRALIAVNRTVPGSEGGGPIPAPRDRSGTVVIAGRPVQPLRPVQQPRDTYRQPVPVFGFRSQPGAPSSPASGSGVQILGTPRPVFRPAPQPGLPSQPRSNFPSAPRPVFTPAPRPSGGSAPSHNSAPAPSHPSGGGGGRPAPSGGGGGGHVGGGGGGGHH